MDIMASKDIIYTCLFCVQRPNRNPGISFHSFPKDKSERSLWLNACGFTEEDFMPYKKLYSLHFDKDCFKTGNILKPNSVPTTFCRRSNEFFESMSSSMMPELLTHQISEQTASTSNSQMETSEINDTLNRTPKKYFVDNVTTPDFVTLRKVNNNFTKAKYQIIQQRKKIKYLNLKVNRLSSMDELIIQMNKKIF